MWFHEQKKAVFPGQTVSPTVAPPANYVDEMKLPPTTNASDGEFLAEQSRKRKLMDMNQGDNYNSPLVLNPCPRESYLQHNAGSLSEMAVGSNLMGSVSDSKPNIMVPQYGNYQFHSLNSFPVSTQINDGKVSLAPTQRMNHYSFNPEVPSPAFHSPDVERSALSDPLALAYNRSCQVEATRFHSNFQPSITCLEKEGLGLKDSMTFGPTSNIPTHDSSFQLHNAASEPLASSEASTLTHEPTQNVSSGGLTSVMVPCKAGSSLEVNQLDQALAVGCSRDKPGLRTGPSVSSSCTEEKSFVQPDGHCNNEVKSGTPLDTSVASNVMARDQAYGHCNNDILKEAETSCLGSTGNSLEKEAATKSDDLCTKVNIEQGQVENCRHSSSHLDDKSKPRTGKTVPTVLEKLWDGSLQLSTSVTVSAVAFFKSGEKAPELNWSKSIEVKGKVRLEAFEKYIQELPRSRTRALMVISFCWKVGSAETGFTGMKEVAKGYKEGEKVGFAEVSPGLDIYVCPRSDKIITILAKYGFFKGMAAVDGDQDSLIGCVVWRRKHSSVDSTSKRTERKNPSLTEQPLSSLSDTAIQQNAEENAPVLQQTTGSRPLCSEPMVVARESLGSNTISSSSRLEDGNPSSTVNSNLTPSVSDNSTSILRGCQTATSSDWSTTASAKKFVGPLMCGLGSVQPDSCVVVPKAVSPPPSQVINHQNRPSFDDDEDLPEFDFDAACGVYRSPVKKPLSSSGAVQVPVAPMEKKFSPERIKNVGNPFPSTLSTAPQVIVWNQQKMEDPFYRSFHFNSNQGKTPLNLGKNDQQGGDEKLNFHDSKSSNQSDAAMPRRKNLWDDDDMPEWSPPDMDDQNQNRNQPPALATLRGTSDTSIASPAQYPISQNAHLHPPPPGPIHPSVPPERFPPTLPVPSHLPVQRERVHPPPPMPVHPSPQAVRLPPLAPLPPMPRYSTFRPELSSTSYQQYPAPVTMNPTQPGPVTAAYTFNPSSTGFNFNPALKPPSGINAFDVRPVRPTDWRGWRP